MSDLNAFLVRKATFQAREEAIATWHLNAFVNGGIDLPYSHNETWVNVNVYEKQDDGGWVIDPEATLDRLAAIADFVASSDGVEAEKKYDASGFFELVVDLGEATKVRYVADRESVCTKKVTGYKDVPEKITPARREEIVEWECDPVSLVARSKANKRAAEEVAS